MDLLLDVGNTRIKWATFDGQTLSPQQAEPYQTWNAEQLRTRVLAPAGSVRRVLIANVAGERIAQLLIEATQSELGVSPEFMQSAASFGEVRNAYPDPTLLGVDRWMALIAVHARNRRAACIVCVGTAMTVDGLDADGCHLGGVIVPGPDLMITSLMKGTSDIAARAAKGRHNDELFADNTLGGVQQGAAHALASLVERAITRMSTQLGAAPLLLLTGGASARIERLLQTPFQVLPDLVLQGLAVIAKQSITQGV